MAQTGYTPILIYSSSTASNTPAAGNLTNSTLGSELAINIADGKLFYKDSGGSVQVIGWKVVPTTAGGTGLTSYTAGDTLYYASGSTLSKLGIGSANYVMTSSGSAPQWVAQSTLSVGTALNHLSNSSTGVMQITGPSAGTTRVMTIPDSNYTVARTDAGQTFTGNQRINGNLGVQTAANTTSSTDVSLDLGGTNSSNYTGYVNATIGKGATWNGTNWVYTTGYADAKLFALSYSSGFIWYWAASGSAGANVSFTQLASLNQSGDFTPIGNLVQGTAAKGINFTANTPAAGKTSQLLNWYEEGTFTPTLGGTWTTNPTSLNGTYVRIGRIVHIVFTFVGGAKSSATSGWFDSMPFNISVSGTGSVVDSNIVNYGLALAANTTRIWVTNNSFGAGTNYVSLFYMA